MKSLILLIALSTVAFSSARAPTTKPSVTPSVTSSPLVSHDPGRVVFAPIERYTTPAERLKVKSAEIKLNATIHSQCFRDFIASRALIQTNGRTPAAVADHLQGLSGVVPVKFYYSRWSSAVAYRQPPSQEINFNRKFLGANSSDCDFASVEGHESIGHSLGEYEHAFKWNAQRDFSVPYSINKAFEKCCKEMK